MNKFINALSLIALFGFATPASAANWFFIGSTGTGQDAALTFADRETFGQSSSSIKKTWIFRIRKKLDTDGVRKSKTLWSFDCSAKTMKLVSYIDYGNNDVVAKSGDIPYFSQKDSYVVPDSIGESEWRFVCAENSGAFSIGNMSPEEFSANIFRFGDK